MKISISHISSFIVLLLFVGCSSIPKELHTKKQIELPDKYTNNANDLKIKDNWLLDFNSKSLEKLVNKALLNNYQLKRLYYDVNISKQNLIGSQSYLLPELDLSLNHSKSGELEGSSNGDTTTLNLGMSYEIDIWGKLSDSQRKANMQLLQSQALYEEAKQKLVVDVSIAYFNILESNLLLKLYEKNLENANNNYKIINKRYKSGLNTILDRYQAKNIVYEQESKISAQQTIKSNALHTLKKHLGKYSNEILAITDNLPELKTPLRVGLPSQLILKKASLTASWNKLLAQNHHLAFTHKQRLPSLSLSASLERSSVNGVPLIWSLISGITAPIFNAGRLKANEQIATLELKKIELEYLENVYNAYIDVESKISQEKNLFDQYEALIKTRDNAKITAELSFKQYLKGLVQYSIVLDNQDKYYNAQASLIQIKKQLLENRINLHFSLGGDFSSNNNKKGNI